MVGPIIASSSFADRLDVREFGADFGVDSTTEIQAAVNAATAGQEVFFPSTQGRGDWITSQIDLSGSACSLRGAGDKTNIRQAAGAGVPLISFSGSTGVSFGIGKRRHGDFRLYGNGGTNVAEHAIYMNGDDGHHLQNISAQDFGGSGLRVEGSSHFNVFENMVFGRPTTGDASDTPYVHCSGPFNGNQMYNIGLRALTTDPCPLHCVVIEDNGASSPYSNNFYGWWIQSIRVKEGGSIFLGRSLNACNIEIPMMHDTAAVPAAPVDGCVVRLESGGAQDLGGNYVWGQTWGDSGAPNAIPFGVVLAQSRNRVSGVLGFNQGGVRLDAGVDYSHVQIGGRVSGVLQSGIVDNSGTTTNTLLDDYGDWRFAAHTNVPWTVEATGSFTGDGATTVFNIAHGLNTAVSAPQIQLRNTTTNEVNPAVTYAWVDADTVSVTFGAAPTNGHVFEWRAV